jgi:hypothetical protein
MGEALSLKPYSILIQHIFKCMYIKYIHILFETCIFSFDYMSWWYFYIRYSYRFFVHFFDPATSGLWAQHALLHRSATSFTNFSKKWKLQYKTTDEALIVLSVIPGSPFLGLALPSPKLCQIVLQSTAAIQTPTSTVQKSTFPHNTERFKKFWPSAKC